MAIQQLKSQNNKHGLNSIQPDQPEQMLFRNVLEASLNEVYIFYAETLHFQYVNAPALRNLGYSLAQMQKMTQIEIQPEIDEILFRRLIAPLVAGQQEKLEFQTVHQRSDGTRYPVEVYLQLIEDRGEPLFLAIILDITERQQQELAIEESDNLFHAVIEGIPDALFVKDLQGRYIKINSAGAKMMGKSAEEVIGKDDTELFPPVIGYQLMAVERHIMMTGETQIFEEVTAANGMTRTYTFTKSVYRHPQGNVIGLIGIARDITKQKLTECALQNANEELEIKVEERTIEFKRAIKRLKNEMAERQFAQKALAETISDRHQAEQERDRFFQLSLNMLYIGSFDGEIKQLNPAWEKNLGWTIEELQTKPFIKWVHPEDRKATLAQSQTVAKGTNIIGFENRFLCKDGSYKWLMWSSVSLPEQELIYAVAHDITERKQAEEALLRSQEKNHVFLNAIPDLMFHVSKDGIYLDFIAAKTDELATHPSEIVGKNIREFLPIDIAEQAMHYVKKTLETGKTQIFEYQMPLDDNLRDYEARLVVSGKDEVMAIVRDISDRKQAEEELRSTQVLLNSIIENLPSAVFLKDAEELRFMIWNKTAEEITGFSIEEMKGKNNHDLFPAEQAEFFTIKDREALNSRKLIDIPEEPIQTRHQNLRFLHTKKIPICDAAGNPKYLLGISEDITESLQHAKLRKQAERALQQSEAQLREQTHQLEQTLRELQQTQAQLVQTEKMSSLGQLVAGVAHEINNPVNFIYGNLCHTSDYTEELLNLVSLYQEYYPHPPGKIQEEIEAIDFDFLKEDLPKMLNSMKVGAERIREIVLCLRNFSRLDESEMKEVDIHEGIESTLMILQNRLKGNSNRLPIQVIKEYGKLPKVNCYAGQLNQVFMNLIANAIDVLDDYNNQQSIAEINQDPRTIRIRTEIFNTNQIAVRIIDNGSGIDEHLCSRLFDPFFTTKPVGKGTGLGLSISYQIVVEKHGGELQCFSAPGKGAEFVMTIPIQR